MKPRGVSPMEINPSWSPYHSPRRWNHVATSTSVSDLQWSGVSHPDFFSSGDREIFFHEFFFQKEICRVKHVIGLPGFGNVLVPRWDSWTWILLEVLVGPVGVCWCHPSALAIWAIHPISHRLYLDHWVATLHIARKNKLAWLSHIVVPGKLAMLNRWNTGS